MSMNTQGRPTGLRFHAGVAQSGRASLLPSEAAAVRDRRRRAFRRRPAEEVLNRTGLAAASRKLGHLAGLTEPEALRHYVRLSRATTRSTGMYPLGSCTMKHNPRLNEKMARLPGFADIHPLQPVSTVQGALELMRSSATG
jgi:glycine dehydrogenase subunit 2